MNYSADKKKVHRIYNELTFMEIFPFSRNHRNESTVDL
jgi:hypothetical protein